MLDEEAIAQQKILETYRRNLAHLVRQAAQYGGESQAPPHVVNGIHESREQIRYIKTVLRDAGVDVSDAPYDRPAQSYIASFPPEPETAEQLAVRHMAYRQRILEETRYVNFKGIPLPRDRSGRPIPLRVPLDSVYIRIQAIAEEQSLAQQEAERQQLERHLARHSEFAHQSMRHLKRRIRELGEFFHRQGIVYAGTERPSPIDPQAALGEHSRLVILGAPGSGKSTLLRFLARTTAADPEAPIPILVSLRDYASEHPGSHTTTPHDLRDFALNKAAENDQALRHALEQAPRLLWLVDALDEARDLRTQLMGQIRQLPGDLILTSRPLGYQSGALEDLPHFEILPLVAEEIDRFLKDWFGVLAQQNARDAGWVAERIVWLKEQLSNRPQIQKLTRNPLLLTFLVILAGESPARDLPAQRSEIYRRYIEELLDTWEDHRHPRMGQSDRPHFRLGQVAGERARQIALRGLYYMGWYIHLAYHGGPPDYQPMRSTLLQALSRYLSADGPSAAAPETTRAILAFWQEAGIIEEWSIDDMTLLAFRHLTFQEYAAAWGLVTAYKNNPKEFLAFLRPRLHHYAWREPILLLAGMPEAESLVKELAPLLLQGVSAYESLLYRDLRLAALFANEAIHIDEAGRREPVERLSRLAQERKTWRRLILWATYVLSTLVIASALYIISGPLDITLVVVFVTLWSMLWFWTFEESQIPMLQVLFTAPLRLSKCSPYLTSFLEVLKQLGVPILQSFVHDTNRQVREAVTRSLGALGSTEAVMNALQDRDWHVRLAAAETLKQLRAPEAIAVLVLALVDPHKPVRLAASSALDSILKADDDTVRGAALAILKQTEASLLETLVRALDDSSAVVREAAARTLAQSGDPARSRLLEALSDRRRRVRSAAVQGTGELGTLALPMLEHALMDADRRVRIAATAGLARVGLSALPALEQALADPRRKVVSSAAQGLIRIAHINSLSLLIQALASPRGIVRKEAALQLMDLTFYDRLEENAQTSQEAVQWLRALKALRQLDDSELISALVHALVSKNSLIREASADIISVLLRPSDRAEKTDITTAIRRIESSITPLLSRALNGSGSSIPWLSQVWKSSDLPARRAAAVMLGHLGDAGLPLLERALADPSKHVRGAAAYGLGHIGDASLPLLERALADRSNNVREQAAYGLGELGDAGLPLLERALADRSKNVREAARSGLTRLGQVAPALLVRLVMHRSQHIRIAAAKAIQQVAVIDSKSEKFNDVVRRLDKSVLDQLVQVLGNTKDSRIRFSLALCLGAAGRLSCLPILVRALYYQGDSYTRAYIAKLLEQLVTELEDASYAHTIIRALRLRLTDRPDVAEASFNALEALANRLAVLQQQDAIDPLLPL